MFVRALYENARMCPVKRGSKNRTKHNLPNHKQRLIHVSQYKMLCANLKKTAGKIKENEAGKQACRKAILLLFAEREGVRACARARGRACMCVYERAHARARARVFIRFPVQSKNTRVQG